MKTKSILLGLILCCFSVFAIFGMAGCGETSLGTLETNFQKLDETYESYDEVFVSGNCDGLTTDYLVSTYGATVDEHILAGEETYAELMSLYNSTLAMASAYIDNNRTFILGLDEKKLSKSSKDALTKVNSSLVDYTKSISAFATARENLISHFKNFGGQDENSDLGSLLRFKKVYGDMVKKNVALSTATAKLVETTEIFDLLKSTTPTASDTETVKQYIRAKLLPIYSEFKITEIANEMNWDAQKEGDCKTRIEALIANVDSSFEVFKENFVEKTTEKVMTADELNKVFDLAEEFFKWTDASYFKALSGLNLSKLATVYDNELETYKKSNAFAEIYLQNLEQFVDVSVDGFMDAVCKIIY